VTLVLIISGIYLLSQNISQLENQKNVYDQLTASEQITYKANIVSRTTILDNVDMSDTEKSAVYDALALVTFTDSNVDGIQEMVINQAADSAFMDQATPSMRIILRLAITILPIILIYFAFLILNKKFIISEEYYENITKDILKRAALDPEAEM